MFKIKGFLAIRLCHFYIKIAARKLKLECILEQHSILILGYE